MAGQARKKCEYSKNDILFVGRFVYDVLAYTLTKCGLPYTKIPNIDCEANVYHRSNFVEIAAASTLRLCLLFREKWRQSFISERNSFVSNSLDISLFLTKLAINCSRTRARAIQSAVEVLLASCNELLLFLHHEDVDIDVKKLMKSVSLYILVLNEPKKSEVKTELKSQKISEKIEGLFDEFDNVSRYIKWITGFIKKYASPYGSRDDVSNMFLERVKRQYLELKEAIPPGIPLLNTVKYHFGYLPLDFLSYITVAESRALPGNLASTAGSTLQDSSKSREQAKLPCTYDSGVPERKKWREMRSTRSDVSEQTTKSKQSCKKLSELGIEDDLRKISLNVKGASETSQGAIPKRKKIEKKSNKK